ncbi:MAG TPA: HD domain-containing protein [Mycobacterium sp.]|nr:HD domain-containing protein [Mycobacterium sp.]
MITFEGAEPACAAGIRTRSERSTTAGRPLWSASHACLLAAQLLSDLPDRLAHSLLAGRQAQRVRITVAPADRELLVAAAVLHDIGYSPALVQTGFHPLDGANYLALLGAPQRLASLVAHHSEARYLAAARALDRELSCFRREDGPVMDALVYADMTSGPTGAPMTITERLADIASRHDMEDPELFAARLARVPHLLAAGERVQRRSRWTTRKRR